MAKSIFQIYDGRKNFWQWDTKQKLIVLDDTITQVHFSNKNMKHSISRDVYEYEGMRVVNVPDTLLQVSVNLVAHAYINNGKARSTKSSTTFSVTERPIPFNDGYSDNCEQNAAIEDMLVKIEKLEQLIKDIESGAQEFIKFSDMMEAAKWAVNSGEAGDIVVVKLNAGWVPHVVEDDKSLSPICNCDGEMVIVNIMDGGDEDGYEKEETEGQRIIYWDGGGAAGI